MKRTGKPYFGSWGKLIPLLLAVLVLSCVPKSKYQDLKEDRSSARKEKEQLEARDSTLRKELEELRKDSARAAKEVKKLEEKLARIREKKEQAIDRECDSLRTEYAVARRSLDSVKATNKAMIKALKALRSDMERLKGQVEKDENGETAP